ncbi:alpha/beta fold hydrolase [Schinkia azotoformans]|uniref:alpha/beta fold hydrolase n=1 Tax=Schinkia azotoformans TaxID=1454 RepID=UPI002DB6AEE7|nr:alpha/beta fold hydrolase [Schinkia azotoformans]MEC1714817.1 alpha/beta fold hydrolase [Schinkia azotoformans]MEC1741723.1 alpha/beta fold hydrolase [Schinkia azotoformans]MEC1766599.1 alpha/beta fold hydrolase [Schinkia azotoformans]MEC1788014.1 alpha/beta fold hydrolase [Schinkia azotoformans]MED4375420.1 alpha/beta fold hydrolase [Schinkia azotoformans]
MPKICNKLIIIPLIVMLFFTATPQISYGNVDEVSEVDIIFKSKDIQNLYLSLLKYEKYVESFEDNSIGYSMENGYPMYLYTFGKMYWGLYLLTGDLYYKEKFLKSVNATENVRNTDWTWNYFNGKTFNSEPSALYNCLFADLFIDAYKLTNNEKYLNWAKESVNRLPEFLYASDKESVYNYYFNIFVVISEYLNNSSEQDNRLVEAGKFAFDNAMKGYDTKTKRWYYSPENYSENKYNGHDANYQLAQMENFLIHKDAIGKIFPKEYEYFKKEIPLMLPVVLEYQLPSGAFYYNESAPDSTETIGIVLSFFSMYDEEFGTDNSNNIKKAISTILQRQAANGAYYKTKSSKDIEIWFGDDLASRIPVVLLKQKKDGDLITDSNIIINSTNKNTILDLNIIASISEDLYGALTKYDPLKFNQIKDSYKNIISDSLGITPYDGVVPFSLKTISEEDKVDHIRRKVRFQVALNDYIDAYLLLPKGVKYPRPAILALHQTVPQGKLETVGISGTEDMAYGLELVRRGYIVFAPDTITAGERIKQNESPYSTQNFDKTYPQWSAMGKMLWDHQRSLDLLETLEIVNADKIGVIGHSLGGYNALFLAAFDNRIKAVVASSAYTRMEHDPGVKRWARDSGFVHFPKLKLKIDNGEPLPWDFEHLLTVISPKPIFQSFGVYDSIFPNTITTSQVHNYVKPLYKNEEDLNTIIFNGGHNFPPEVRNMSYQFLDKNLNNENWPTISINGKQMLITIKPKIINGTIFISAKDIASQLGFNKEWNHQEKRVVLFDINNKIVFEKGKKEMVFNGVRQPINGNPYINYGNIMVPLISIFEALDYKISWNKEFNDFEIIS